MTDNLCVCGPVTRAQGHCDCGAEESAADLRYGGCCGDPGGPPKRGAMSMGDLFRALRAAGYDPPSSCEADEALGRATLDRPYFDLDGNEGALSEVYS